jgi:hypothetical protein
MRWSSSPRREESRSSAQDERGHIIPQECLGVVESGGRFLVTALSAQHVREVRENRALVEAVADLLELGDALPECRLRHLEITRDELAPSPALPVDRLAIPHAQLSVETIRCDVELPPLGHVAAAHLQRGQDLERAHLGQRPVELREQSIAELGDLGDGPPRRPPDSERSASSLPGSDRRAERGRAPAP